MRIAFDISQTGSLKAGCGYLAYSLIQHLHALDRSNEYLFLPTFGDGYWDPNWSAANLELTGPNFQRGLWHQTREQAVQFWSSPPDDFEAQLDYPDIVHSNNFFCPVGLKRAKLVYTLHDLAFLEYPDCTEEYTRHICFTGVYRASLSADLIIAVSHSTRKAFLKFFPHYPADKIVVIHEGSRFPGPLGEPRPPELEGLEPGSFWLTVGTVEPRKNHARLLRAFSRLTDSPYPLVMAGGKGWLHQEFQATLEDLNLGDRLKILGYVDDATLRWLYENCFALVYPSLYEGFGLPVLEAMSLGAAVITSNTSSLPEVVGDAGILVNPLEEDSIQQAMAQLQSDPSLRGTLRSRAVEQARRFNWDSSATAVMNCYSRLKEQ